MGTEANEISILSENEHTKIELENGILIATWKSSFVDLDIAKEAVINRLLVTNGQKYPVLIKIKSVRSSTKEARDFLASEKGCAAVIAGAVYVDSILENMIATFFIFLNKPSVPLKIFKDETKAKEWLQQFVENTAKN
jgi:hypothetical protein